MRDLPGTVEASAGDLLGRLARQPPDSLLSLIGAFRDDPRPDKIDLGVGVFRTEDGITPVMRAVKAAERRLLETQQTKAYLGPEGDERFFAALRPLVFGAADPGDRVFGLQTPGGTGALRLAAELIAAATSDARILVGTPCWANHPPILQRAGLAQHPYRHFDVANERLCFEELLAAVGGARAGDAVLLQASCHNPTGADLAAEQWRKLATLIARRGVVPLLDLAYQGLGAGLDGDAAGVRAVLEVVPEALIAYSCDKNFGLYRERTGALFGVARTAATARVAQSNALALARASWSMPPDHGAAAVRLILEDEALAGDWRAELATMRARIADLRTELATLDPALGFLRDQRGMFSTLPISPEAVRRLREEAAIYLPASGRINVAGLTYANLPRFAAALREWA